MLPLTAFVEVSWQFCSEYTPQNKETLASAIRDWRLTNGISVIDDLVTAGSTSSNDLAVAYSKMRNTQGLKLYRKISAEEAPSWCERLPKLLVTPEWQVGTRNASGLSQLHAFATRLHKQKPLPAALRLPSLLVPSNKQLRLARIDPKQQPIPDAFHCYREKAGRSYLWPDMIIQIRNKNEYRSSFGHGRYQMEKKKNSTTIEWLDGPFKKKKSHLKYDRFGQRFSLSTSIADQFYEFHCFQRGASDRHAQQSYRLRDPQPGSYQCRDLGSGIQQELELSSDQGYTLGNHKGSYRVEDIIGRSGVSSSKIIWLSGPLAEEKKNSSSRYSEEEGTGLRSLRISTTKSRFVMGTGGSSSKLTAVCTAKGEPVHFEKYGKHKAPPPPEKAGGLDGFYYTMEDRFSYWNQESADAPRYYRFFSKGYLFEGEPDGDPGNIDCSRTLPNGAPLCSLYFLGKERIRIGDKEPLAFRREGKSLQIGEKKYLPVPKNAREQLDGRFSHSKFSQWGTMDWGGSDFQKIIFTFFPDGRFRKEKEGQNTHSFDAGPLGMDIPGASIYGMGNSHDNNSGNYRIDGHTITLRYNNGRVEQRFIWIRDADHIYMMDRAFTREKTK